MTILKLIGALLVFMLLIAVAFRLGCQHERWAAALATLILMGYFMLAFPAPENG